MKLFRYKVKGHIAFLWKFCNENNITFQIKDIWKPPLPHTNNFNLMEFVTAIPKIAKTSIRQIEACRLYLQVSNLSDITTQDGKFICPNQISPPHNFTPPNNLHWPHQPKPVQAAWDRWKTC